jgi:prepilin-type N-terminal cleavage/methylation domain-containing protein
VKTQRSGFTLLELILALSLVVVATALIGNLMHIYSRNFATRGEDIRRMQLARSILNMIAEDLRAVVLKQEYDGSVLQQQLGAGGAGGGGGGAGATGAGATGAGATGAGATGAGATGAGATGAGATGAGAGAAGAGATGAGTTGTGTATDATVVTTSFVREPGIYGTQYELMLDVSRIPRVDEYIPAQASLLSPTLTDVPGDIKTVTYFVQTPTTMGVDDSLNAFNDATQTMSSNSGLVRRQLDRAILAYADEMGDTTRLARTGELIAPEVVSLEFAFYDGTQWLYEWDSSTQSLPWLVQITLAIQTATGEEKAALESGVALSALTFDQQKAYGIQVYELVVAIPGAQLRAADAQSADAAAGMESMGL